MISSETRKDVGKVKEAFLLVDKLYIDNNLYVENN